MQRASDPERGPASVPGAPIRSRGQRTKTVGIAIAAIIAVAVVGMLIAIGVFQGSSPSTSQYRLKNGDYAIYSIVGQFNYVSVNGTERDDILNVTAAGYDMTTTYYNIPGSMPSTKHFSWNNSGNSSGLVFVDTEAIRTIWGLKRVDKYSYTESSQTWYYFIGHETGYGMYREDYQSGNNWMTWEIKETSISYYWEKNNA